MEPSDVTTLSGNPPDTQEEGTTLATETRSAATPSPELPTDPCSCGRPGGRCVCGAAEAADLDDDLAPAAAFVYAIGRIEPRFPTLAVEKEFAQATGRADTNGLTNRQALHEVLSKPENRYLTRQLCCVLTIEGIETYIVQPRDPVDFNLLVEAVRAAPSPMDVDVVIGVRGPVAPPELCNGLMVPIVAFDQIYSFDRDSLIKSIPRPEGVTAKQFEPASEELLERILQVADNAGATDEHRALNYLAMRYPPIYTKAAEEYARDSSLTEVSVRPSPLSGTRRIMETVFSYTNRSTDFTEKFFVRVDVTEEFPFLLTKLSPYLTGD
jgi:PatG Domain